MCQLANEQCSDAGYITLCDGAKAYVNFTVGITGSNNIQSVNGEYIKQSHRVV